MVHSLSAELTAKSELPQGTIGVPANLSSRYCICLFGEKFAEHMNRNTTSAMNVGRCLEKCYIVKSCASENEYYFPGGKKQTC